MKMAIFTHVPHYRSDEGWWGYGPYVREMNSWAKFTDQFLIVAPVKQAKDRIDLQYEGVDIKVAKIPAFSLVNLKQAIRACWLIPGIVIRIYRAMKEAEHLHLRCPGNIGLLAALVQICFPSKPKTAKYAGNWDPLAKQPRSYRIQKWLLSNTYLTKNMQVLVYGDWPDQTVNVKPFFTASYRDADKQILAQRAYNQPWRFVFAGTLSAGKQPLYVIKLLSSLGKKLEWKLDYFGNGEQYDDLSKYISTKDLSERVVLHGNVPQDRLKEELKAAHFLVLPSLSEGWPKVLAEAMWWGCIPVALPVSCVPWMLDQGNRGLIITGDVNSDGAELTKLISDPVGLKTMSEAGSVWSRQYTMDLFEAEIQKLLK
ncbi:glycosyltransferase family 4 protein [Aureitalea marina]|uniref:Glycosyl transferase n=1 Tax=Aureitalea marina TaxID=930804 RepID=A0A2S7KMU9_9FLAO|nr:glycosyltransferase [Aureitalea marina]PQB03893.1 glycosyl transferase [Aureitalea marina]